MRRSNRWWSLLALALLAAAVGCADGSIDDPDGPNSVLEILSLENQPVTCGVTSGFCAGDAATSCDTSQGCVINQVDLGPCLITLSLEVSDWTGTAANVPRTVLANTSPFNDITLDGVTITYNWGTTCLTTTNFVGLSATVPADGTATFSFGPIELEAVGTCLGSTADTTLVFSWHTPTDSSTTTVFRELNVESCN